MKKFKKYIVLLFLPIVLLGCVQKGVSDSTSGDTGTIDKNDTMKILINNNISEFEIIKSNIFDNFSKDNRFDVILSNPPIRTGKETIFKIYEESYGKLNKDGEFWCVIQTKHGAKSTQKKIEQVFGNCETMEIEGGYRIFRAVKKV